MSITREMIRDGINQGLVKFITDPNLEAGTVCKIGDYWLYFGGQTAEDESPEEYLNGSDMEENVGMIYEALDGFMTDFPTEYAYYEAFLRENLIPFY